MHIPSIKKLVETVSLEELMKAEESIIEELPLVIEIPGNDEGEQLTHVMAAIWILECLKTNPSLQFKDALREYTQKVRSSIN